MAESLELFSTNDMTCCKNPAQYNMHEFKYSPNENGYHYPEPCWNRVCTNCYTHWYGHPDKLKKYTRKEWDAMIEGSFNDYSQRFN